MKRRYLHLALYFMTAVFFGCTGYHFNTNNNPLLSYEIKSLAVPMFVNRTNIPALNSYMTKEIILSLNDFSGLKVFGGDKDEADAVLIGVLESEDLYNKTFKTTETLFTDQDNNIKDSVGNRAPFYYASKTAYDFQLRFYLIKRPTAREIELLKSDLGKLIKNNPKIVLSEVLPVSGNYIRAVSDNLTATSGGTVNYTKNKGLLIKSLQDISYQTANNFKQVVLNAF